MKVYRLAEYFDSSHNTSLTLGIYAKRDAAEAERKRILSKSKDVEHFDSSRLETFWTHDCFAVIEEEVIE